MSQGLTSRRVSSAINYGTVCMHVFSIVIIRTESHRAQ